MEHGTTSRSTDRHGLGQGRDHGLRRGDRRVALVDHDPAHVVEHRLAVLVDPDRVHVDDAGATVGVLLEPDDLGRGGQGVARVDGHAENARGIPEVGDRIERHVRHRLAEDDVEDEHRVQRHPLQTQPARKGLAAGHREP
jgi:hypothetical protein